MMNRTEAIGYLTRCADDNGNHWHGGAIWAMANCPNDIATCPNCHGTNVDNARCDSRYGTWSSECAEVAYRHAAWFARETGQELDTRILSDTMRDVVNSHPDIATDLQGYAAELAGANVDAMVEGYLSCQLAIQHGGDWAEPTTLADSGHTRESIADEYVETIRDEIAALVAEHPLAVRMYYTARKGHPATWRGRHEAFGHDFYLTREGHGAGFWDRGLGDLGDYLTQVSKWAGSAADLWDNGDGVLR